MDIATEKIAASRTPRRAAFQGVWNIVRFNWHFYVLAGVLIAFLVTASRFLPDSIRPIASVLYVATVTAMAVSLSVSLYVYDLSGLYRFAWLRSLEINADSCVVNINAGFDETSELIKALHPSTELIVLDFYDPARHTEVSIKRARRAYPPYPGTQSISTASLPLPDHSADCVLLLMSAHEIRSEDERSRFFKEIARIAKPTGKIAVTEHLRDVPNFLAYNIGFFHFFSQNAWQRTFAQAGLQVTQKIKTTPFVSTFLLEKQQAF
jgi:hypothetical protein